MMTYLVILRSAELAAYIALLLGVTGLILVVLAVLQRRLARRYPWLG